MEVWQSHKRLFQCLWWHDQGSKRFCRKQIQQFIQNKNAHAGFEYITKPHMWFLVCAILGLWAILTLGHRISLRRFSSSYQVWEMKITCALWQLLWPAISKDLIWRPHCFRFTNFSILFLGCWKVPYCRRLLFPGYRKVPYCHRTAAEGKTGVLFVGALLSWRLLKRPLLANRECITVVDCP